MLSIDTLRLFLHVSAAAIWVGGQFTIAGILPTVRGMGDDAPRQVARAFNRMAWPAYGVAVVTGLWGVLEVPLDAIPHPEIEIKLLVVVLSGLGALIHQFANGNKAMLAIGGAMSSLFGAAAIWVGVALAV
ncbi:MAG: hypothetical protein M9942_12320 [Microthrixaceae bacterium]|nr:hypothetical protein [Microthrixaceae bacterium]MCO5319210.1 hypothetical protein [Microthrixaceae bacterium]